MSTEAGGTAAPVTPLHPEHASNEPQVGDEAAAPIEIKGFEPLMQDEMDLPIEFESDAPYAPHMLLTQAEDALTAAQESIAVNEQEIVASAGDPRTYNMPLQVSALEHAVVSSAASQLVIAGALRSIADQLEELLEFFRTSR